MEKTTAPGADATRINRGLVLEEPLIFEKSSPGRTGVEPVSFDVPEVDATACIPGAMLRDDIEGFPEVAEIDTVRHYTRLSEWNFGIDSGFYPLGSCTMKYNPKVNEQLSRLAGFTGLHPYQDESTAQGALELIYELERYLSEICGLAATTLQPAAGAQGELCGLLMASAWFNSRGEGEKRRKIIIPDTAHGTNPASSHLAGFEVVTVESSARGVLTVDALAEVLDDSVAALMLTNPNTLGLFERNIRAIADAVHEKGALVYCDGANMNALMGLTRLGEMGVDIVQMNLHKTFSTPHGGGGPGSGPVAVTAALEPFLPRPRVVKTGESFSMDFDCPDSIGRLKAFYGHFSIMVRAYSYIRRMGAEGIERTAKSAILNANYVKEQLKGTFHLPFDEPCMHECVFSDKFQQECGVTTMDIAKRMIDYGVHPPTVYFPLVVHGALMVEPTETESIETLDSFIETMKAIDAEARTSPEILRGAPHKTRVGRVDEVRAARQPVLRWRPEA